MAERFALLVLLLVAGCAQLPQVGLVISNTPPPIGACAQPNPAPGCR